jgi:hypothetical protein
MWDRNEVQCTGGKLKLVLMSKAPGDVLARSEGTFEVPLQWDGQRCSYTKIRVEHHAPLTGIPGDPETWKVITFRQAPDSER